MSEKNTEAKYLLEDVSFDHEGAHLAYTLGSGAASKMNEPYILKAEEDLDKAESEEILKEVEGLLKTEASLDDVNDCVVVAAVEAIKGGSGKTKAKVRKSTKKKAISLEADAITETTDIEDTKVMKENEISMSKAELDDLLKMKELLSAYQAKEAEDLRKSKEDFVKSACFIDDVDLVVDMLLKSEDGVVEKLINSAVAAVNKAKDDVRAEMQAEIDAIRAESLRIFEKAEAVKEEFAKAEGIEGSNHSQEDYQEDVVKSNALFNFLSSQNL